MSRLPKIKLSDWDRELRTVLAAEEMPAVTRSLFDIIARRPETAKAYLRLAAAVRAESNLSARLVELMRLRMAFHNQCRTCMSIRYQSGVDAGVTEDLVCSLEKPMEAPDLTPGEKAVLAFTDKFMTNHLAIDDEDFEKLRQHFDEGAIVELNIRLAMSGFGKMAAVFHMVEDLPEHFRDSDAQSLTPWNAPHSVVP